MEGFAIFIVLLIFIGIIVALIVAAIKILTAGSAARAKLAREAPYALSANAVVIGKRTEVGGNDIGIITAYFITFDIEGVGRVEFSVGGDVSGLLFEGDRVLLRYLTNPYRLVDFNLIERASQFQQTQQ